MQITNASQLTGVFPALFTPLMDDDPKNLRNSIDYKKMEKMIDDLIASGVSGILPVGTTGQSATVTHKQHLDIIKFTLDYVDGRVPVIGVLGWYAGLCGVAQGRRPWRRDFSQRLLARGGIAHRS